MRVVSLATRHHTAGASINATVLAQGLAERGHVAETWFIYNAGEMPAREVGSRIFLEKEPQSARELLRAFGSFVGALGAFRPDVLVGFNPLANAWGSITTLRNKHRFVATQRNPADTQRPALRHVDRVVGSTSLYSANICVSDAVRHSFEAYPLSYKAKLRTVYNGLRMLPPLHETPQSSRGKLGLPSTRIIVGCLARLHHQKNVEFLIAVAKEMPELVFAIAGEGPDEPMLRGMVDDYGITDRVLFLGNMKEEQVTRFYNSVDIFAMPSRYEGFGLTMLEAMSEGLPVLSSDIAPLVEVGGNAAKFCPLVVDDWKAALSSLSTDPGQRKRMSLMSIQRSERFTAKNMIDSYLEIASAST